MTLSQKPNWRESLSSYKPEELVMVTFATKKDSHRAIDMFWDEKNPLFNVPRDIVGGRHIPLPKEALPYLLENGLQFKTEEVISRSSLSPNERGSLQLLP